MPIPDLYTVESQENKDGLLQVAVRLHAGHSIFKGHFPGQPVLPGVCMLEMITDMLETHYTTPLQIRQSPLVKFLLMIDPEKTPGIQLNIRHTREGNQITAEGRIFRDDSVFMKFQLILEIMEIH